MSKRMGWLAVALLVGSAGCTSDADLEEQDAPAASEVQTPEATTPASPERMSDAGIAAVVVAANGIDVSYGEIARERASDQRVREFAETMIRDHTAVNESAGELVGRLGVTPEENDVSRSLQASAEEKRAELRSLSGREFDLAYMRNEVEYHRAVLDAMDSLLIPSATNAELRQTLVGVRPAFEAHLEHAEELLQSLEQG